MSSLKRIDSINEQFKATIIWNHLIDALRERVEIKDYKRRFKLYKNCFVASKAVDCLYLYLMQHKEMSQKISSRNQVVHLLNMFIKMRIFRKLYSTNKSHDFQDNRDLYEFTESADVERENKENLLIDSKAKNDQTDSEIVGDLCSKAHNDLAQIENTNGSMNVSYMAANQSVQIGLNDCLRCVVETKGNQILRFLTRISLHRWPLASIAADDHESSKYRPHDSIDGVRRASEMNELRLKSMQLLRVHNRTTNVSNPFSRTNPMYRTVGNSKNENMLYTRPDQTIQEPIYNRSLHPNSLRVGQSKLHQRSFNTLV